MTIDEEMELDERTCTSCGKVSNTVERRYSFGYYAGRLCVDCCGKYADNCGVNQPQGDPTTLDEFMAHGYAGLDGDE